MGSRGRLLFDLNELPSENVEEGEGDGIVRFQPQKALPTPNTNTSELFATSEAPQRIINNNAFSHASSISGFQPFVKAKGMNGSEDSVDRKRLDDMNSGVVSSTKSGDRLGTSVGCLRDSSNSKAETVEREEGEWSDAEAVRDGNSLSEKSLSNCGKESEEDRKDDILDPCTSSSAAVNGISSKDPEPNKDSTGSDPDSNVKSSNTILDAGGISNGDVPIDRGESSLIVKPREIKGVEASHALKCANNLGKKKLDEQKEAMLGKKRNRQVMFLKLEDVRQAGPLKTPRRQNTPLPTSTRIVKEIRAPQPPPERNGEKQIQPVNKDKQVDNACSDGGLQADMTEAKPEYNDEMNPTISARPRRSNSVNDPGMEVQPPPIPRQTSWKQLADTRQPKNLQGSRKLPLGNHSSIEPKLGNKKLPPPKKQVAASSQYVDTSVERLLREVTNEKFWHDPGPRMVEGFPEHHVVGNCHKSLSDGIITVAQIY